MQVAGVHLSYCGNMHPARTLNELRENMSAYVLPVKQALAPGQPFGLGLQLSYALAQRLWQEIEVWREAWAQQELYIFTINGFIYGDFDRAPVKEQVYRPDWHDPRRLEYTNLLANIMATLLAPGQEGSISTVPLGYRGCLAAKQLALATEHLLQHVAHLHRIFQEQNRLVRLALEPEPGCWLANVEDSQNFFEQLFSRQQLRRLQKLSGCAAQQAATVLRRHLGLCYDACHMALAYEDAVQALERLRRAGIGIFKVHISSALRLDLSSEQTERAALLAPFDEPIYLHQVCEQSTRGYITYHDLPVAFKALRKQPPHIPLQWRVHFHVPIFRADLGVLQTTQTHLKSLLATCVQQAQCRHFEVETYTWRVLPAAYQEVDLVNAIVREMEWARQQILPSKVSRA